MQKAGDRLKVSGMAGKAGRVGKAGKEIKSEKLEVHALSPLLYALCGSSQNYKLRTPNFL